MLTGFINKKLGARGEGRGKLFFFSWSNCKRSRHVPLSKLSFDTLTDVTKSKLDANGYK
jgi:hypothetical protein